MSTAQIERIRKMQERMTVEASLETMLEGLAWFGEPRLSMITGEWHARINMHVEGVGATFEVKSGFNHASPKSAVLECAERMLGALGPINATPQPTEALIEG